jgi:molybdenum ABC transporter molybdate-binding protein
MRHKSWALALLLAATVAVTGTPARAETLTLYAAGSLREAMTEIAQVFGTASGVEVKTVFGPSGLLRERIEKGETVDVFASADFGHPAKLKADGRAEVIAMFVRNAVCAISRQKLGLTTENMLGKLLDPAVKIGTSTPKADPLGDYTLELYHRAETLHPSAEKALLAKSTEIFGGASNNAPVGGVDPVVARLQDGTADVVFAYCSGRERLVPMLADLVITDLPAELRVGPEYGLAVLKGAGPKAKDLALFILSPEGQQILAKRGFVPVTLPQG